MTITTEEGDYIIMDCGNGWNPLTVHKKYFEPKYCGLMDLDDLNYMFNIGVEECITNKIICDNAQQVEKLNNIKNDYCDISLSLAVNNIENVITVEMSLFIDRVFMFSFDSDVDEDNIEDYPEPHNIMNMIDNIALFTTINLERREDRKYDKKYSKTLRKNIHFYKVLHKQTRLPDDCIINIMKYFCN